MMHRLKQFDVWRKDHRIELFMINVCASIIALFFVCVSIIIHMDDEDKDFLTNQAVYVSDFTTSISGTEGSIAQVYSNADHTKCGILVHFENPANLSSDAADYKVFVKGFNVKNGRYASKTMTNPSGGYCIFGSTGYALIYLSDADGFGNQAVECVVRSNEVLHREKVTSSDVEDLIEADSSYANYDQYRIIINPSASEAPVVDFLDDLDPAALYRQAIVDGGEADVRQVLSDDIVDMNTAMKAILAYRENLENLNVRVPALPEEIAGDVFDVEEGENGSVLTYTPSYVFSRGVEFDWLHGSLETTSFLTDELLDLKSPSQFFANLQNAPEERSEGMTMLASEWFMRDGTKIVLNERTGLSDNESVSSNIQNYVQAVNSYYNLKHKYQCEDMVSYLALEYNMNAAADSVSGNFGEDVITAW